MSKKHIYSIVLIVIASMSYAQQISQFSQYMNTKFLLNPAATGISGKLNFHLGYRNQWSGFENAPRAYFAGGDYVLGNQHNRFSYIDKSTRVSNPDLFKQFDSTGIAKSVVGGYIYSNNYFPVQSWTFNGSYSYHIPLDEFYISIGGALSVVNHEVNTDGISLLDDNDEEFLALLNTPNTTSIDVNLGFMVYSHNIYFGYAVNRLASNSLRFSGDEFPSNFNTHHYISTGAKFGVIRGLVLKPSLMIRTVSNTPTSFDINLLSEIQKRWALGVSYRREDAIVLIGGVTFNQHYSVFYSYDVNTSTINTVSSGSHEVTLSAKF